MNSIPTAGLPRLAVLLESAEQLALYQEQAGRWPGYEHRLIAMTIYAAAACRDQGLAFSEVMEENRYFTDADYKKAQLESETIDADLIESINRAAIKLGARDGGFPFELGGYFAYLLYLVLSSYHTRAFVLGKLFEEEKPGRILCFGRKESVEKAGLRSSPIGNYHLLLKNSRYAAILEIMEYGANGTGGTPSPMKSIKAWVRKTFPPFVSLYFYLNNRIPFNLRHRLSPGKGMRRGLMLGAPYNWMTLMKEPVERTGIIFDFRETSLDADSLTGEGRLANELNWDGGFHGFDITPLMKPHFAIMEGFLDKMRHRVAGISRDISKYDFVCASMLSFPMQKLVAHLALQAGKPVYVWQHGGNALWAGWPLMEKYCEVQYCSQYISYGVNVTEFYRRYENDYPYFEGPVSVGSTLMDAAMKSFRAAPEQKQGRPVVVYATGKYHQNNTTFPAPRSDERLYQAQRTILAFLEEYGRLHPEARVLFKPNNTPGYSDVPFTLHHVEIAGESVSFRDLLEDASLVVLDAPATTLVEACTTNKPVFALTNRVTFLATALEWMKQRVVTADDPEILVEKMRQFLDSGEYGADVNDREFVKRYGTHLDDGKSMDRALNLLQQTTMKAGR